MSNKSLKTFKYAIVSVGADIDHECFDLLLDDVQIAIVVERNGSDLKESIKDIASGMYNYFRIAATSVNEAEKYIKGFTVMHLKGVDRGRVCCIIKTNNANYTFNQDGENICIDSCSSMCMTDKFVAAILCMKRILDNGSEVTENDIAAICFDSAVSAVLVYRKNEVEV